jgi:hypothetical protein
MHQRVREILWQYFIQCTCGFVAVVEGVVALVEMGGSSKKGRGSGASDCKSSIHEQVVLEVASFHFVCYLPCRG